MKFDFIGDVILGIDFVDDAVILFELNCNKKEDNLMLKF